MSCAKEKLDSMLTHVQLVFCTMDKSGRAVALQVGKNIFDQSLARNNNNKKKTIFLVCLFVQNVHV